MCHTVRDAASSDVYPPVAPLALATRGGVGHLAGSLGPPSAHTGGRGAGREGVHLLSPHTVGQVDRAGVPWRRRLGREGEQGKETGVSV